MHTVTVYVLLAYAAAAPAPMVRKESLYFPVTVGAKRVTELTTVPPPPDLPVTSEFTVTVTKVEEKGATFVVTVEHADKSGRSSSTGVVEVSAKGVFAWEVGGKESEQPTPVLRLDVKPGGSWTRGRTSYTRREEEEVEVPAGKFTAIRLEREEEYRGVKQKLRSWYAPGVGMVKNEVISLGGMTAAILLKSFTPGKDEKKGK